MIAKGDFFLKGYVCEESFTLPFHDYTIALNINRNNIEKLEKLKSEERDLSETGILQISAIDSKENLENLAIDIKNLLSIALGKRIIFDRQVYWANGDSKTLDKPMSKDDNQGEQIIPDFEIKNYLEQTLTIWTNYVKTQKDEIFTIVDYLNQTKYGFIDDRILRTAQAWECASNYWTEKIELSADLKELRGKINSVYKEWKNEKKYIDEDGELGKRLTIPLDQEKLMVRIEKLIKESGLSTSRLNLNLKALKNLRDKVAHTGKISIPGRESIKILHPAIKGLQLILLKRIGYNGLIIGERDNWITFENINEYFE